MLMSYLMKTDKCAEAKLISLYIYTYMKRNAVFSCIEQRRHIRELFLSSAHKISYEWSKQP
jgi:hypothetical protein